MPDHDHSHGHVHGHSHGHAHGNERRLLFAAAIIGGFMLAEVAGGIASGSLALLADAGHMVTDFISLALAFMATRLARKPADGVRTYGYGRLQVLAAFVNGIALFPIAIWIVVEAWHRISSPQPVAGTMLFVIAAIGLAVNVVTFFMLHGSDDKDVNIRAAAAHVAGDLLGSVAAIAAGIVIMTTGWTPIDPLLSVVVAAIIAYSGYKVTKDAGHVLLEAAPFEIDRAAVPPAIVSEIGPVEDVHHVHLWMLTDRMTMATLHARIDRNADAGNAIAEIKTLMKTRFGIDHTTVEIEFGECADRAKGHG
ncbi:MAG: cation transporter [Rhodobiaceae bacterium]|nr:cation transporter [Rhodobiaceae bacterium]MCC0055130.1 cation transporter [Rhodobiaceae bacterium]